MSSTAAATIPMPSMLGRNRELWVGLFVLLGIVAVLLTLFTLTEPSLFRGRMELSARVPNAGGIRRGDSVQLRGVNIGRVKGFALIPGGVRLTLELERGFAIPEDSSAVLRSSSLLGEMVVDIVPGASSQPARAGQEISGTTTSGPFGMAENLAGAASQTLERVQALLSEQTVGNVQSSSQELSAAMQEVSALAAEQRRQLHELTGSLQRSAKGVEGALAGPELARSIERLDSITSRLDGMAGTLERTAQSARAVVGRVENGEGSLGLLNRDSSLYLNANTAITNLNRAAQEITALTADIRKDPKKFMKISVF
ncbi:MAG: MCE family protein [Deltaproteobacteria bacterium]|nr:MCE family protein [Deltaproteobacteria bacterium]